MRTVTASCIAALIAFLGVVVVGTGAAAGAKADPAPYSRPGPYAAGVTTLDMGGTPVEVWYPAAPSSVAAKPKDVYFIKAALPAAIQGILPANVNPPFTEDAYRDVPASPKGPFPIVLFSHGFAGIRQQSTFLTTHLAQWGFVVASPEFLSRDLASVFGAKPADPQTDVQVLAATTQLLRRQNATKGALLSGIVKKGKLAVTGHSAGGFAAIQFGARADVATYIPLSAGGDAGRGPTLSPANKPSLYALGGDDQVVATAKVVKFWKHDVKIPKRLVVIAGAGHTSPTDLCDIGSGGLVQTAIDAGINIPASFGALYDCKKATAPHDTWPVYDQFVTAQLRWAFKIDPKPVGLDQRAAKSFLPTKVEYREKLGR